MTGQMNPAHRSANWHAKRVFFVTPQVFEKDIESGFPLPFYAPIIMSIIIFC